MLKALFAGIAVCAVLFTSCSKVRQLTNINVDIPYSYQDSIPVIPGDSETTVLPAGGVDLPFPSIGVATQSQQYVSQYGTAVNLVLDVYLKSLSMSIPSPAGRNFDFLDQMDVYVSSKNLPEVLVATQHNIAKGQNTLDLVTDTTVNLKDYYLEDTVYFRLHAHINAVPPSGEVLQVSSVFHMLANPLQ